MLVLDFETRSECDLKLCGTHVYTHHESTDILCISLYDMDTEESVVFDPVETDIPQVWKDKLNSADLVVAHNAAFDKGIYTIGVKEYGFPPIADDRWYCSSAQMRVNAIPASLDDAARALGVKNQKSFKGARLIKKLSIPQEDGTFNENPELMEEMRTYCLQDTVTTVDIIRATRLMTQEEHSDWLLNERVNERGVRVDVEVAELAQSYAAEEQDGIAAELVKLTDGVVTKPTQHQRIKPYILEGLDMKDESDRKLKALMTKKDGKFTLDAKTRETVLSLIDAGNLELVEETEELIRLLDDATATSVAKFKRMQHMAGLHDRVRGAFIYYGASQTGRFSSKGLQLHNMKRDCYELADFLDLKAKMQQGVKIPDVMNTLSKMLRPTLIAGEGKTFVVGDWSSIEARGLPWLANTPDAEKKLDLFRQGVDVYVKAAESIGIDDRRIGKVAELSLGYGGAIGAFSAMAINYGLVLPEYQVDRIVKNWRRANKWAVLFWAEVEQAAKKAVRARGKQQFKAGRVVYTYAPALMGGTLLCILPDQSIIQYPNCHIDYSDRGDNLVCLKASIRPKADSKDNWGTVRLWGGLMVENITQAFCAGLLRDKLRVAEVEGIDIVAHIHDELVAECELEFADEVGEDLKIIMEAVPSYAKGLPLKAEPVQMVRYGNH